jgi:hypothetical protein
MIGKPGNRIIVESQRVGQLEREGEILEVMQTGVSVRYRVRWSDGHESTLTPAGGIARVLPTADATAEATTRNKGKKDKKSKGTKKA